MQEVPGINISKEEGDRHKVGSVGGTVLIGAGSDQISLMTPESKRLWWEVSQSRKCLVYKLDYYGNLLVSAFTFRLGGC